MHEPVVTEVERDRELRASGMALDDDTAAGVQEKLGALVGDPFHRVPGASDLANQLHARPAGARRHEELSSHADKPESVRSQRRIA